MKKKLIFLTFIAFITLNACNKFLDEKPNKSLVIPEKLSDLQALLDDYTALNRAPAILEMSSDDYYLDLTDWEGLARDEERRTYVWEKDYLYTTDWLYMYRNIYRANVVLDHIDNIDRTPETQNEWDNVKGQALFIRGIATLHVASAWSKAYDPNTAESELGIPLRLSSDFNVVSVRPTLKAMYLQIKEDLLAAYNLLPVNIPHVARPSKAVALAALARLSLYMREFDECITFSEEALSYRSELMDFNELSEVANYPFEQFNSEVIYSSRTPVTSSINNSRAKIDSLLMRTYDANDLRLSLFFVQNTDASFSYRGSYDGSLSLFSGFSTNELILMLAECYARIGEVNSSLDALNRLLRMRFKRDKFLDVIVEDSDELLSLVLLERRKELLMRGLRWMDVKRLNIEGRDISMSRNLGNLRYELPANDERFALPIPEDVVLMTGMQQNSR